MEHKKLITLTPRRKRVIEVMVSSGHAKNEMDAVMRCIDLAATELLNRAEREGKLVYRDEVSCKQDA